MHAQYSREELNAKRKKTMDDKFLNQALAEAREPIDLDEARRRAEHLKKAYYAKLSARGVAARNPTGGDAA